MQITIDTKHDTHEDIRKVIRLLTHLIGEHPTSNQPTVFEDPTPTSNQPNVFADSTPTTSQPKAPSGNIFGNMFENPQPKEAIGPEETTRVQEQKEEETPEIIPY